MSGGRGAREWSPADEAALRRLYSVHGPSWDGWDVALPGRSLGAIKTHANRMGLKAGRRDAEAWTPNEERAMLALVEGAADRLGRTPDQVVERVAVLWMRRRREGRTA